MDSRKMYELAQKQYMTENDIKIGDMVRVTRSANKGDNGWDNTWMREMHTSVGKTVVVSSYDVNGVRFEDMLYAYPFFVLEKVKELSYEEAQAKWMEENNIKPGDTVRVTRKAKPYENGWGTHWASSSMDRFVGETLTIRRVASSKTYGFEMKEHGCVYPYFILEKVGPIELHRDAFKKWVEENNVKPGTKVKIVREFTDEMLKGYPRWEGETRNVRAVRQSIGEIYKVNDLDFSDGALELTSRIGEPGQTYYIPFDVCEVVKPEEEYPLTFDDLEEGRYYICKEAQGRGVLRCEDTDEDNPDALMNPEEEPLCCGMDCDACQARFSTACYSGLHFKAWTPIEGEKILHANGTAGVHEDAVDYLADIHPITFKDYLMETGVVKMESPFVGKMLKDVINAIPNGTVVELSGCHLGFICSDPNTSGNIWVGESCRSWEQAYGYMTNTIKALHGKMDNFTSLVKFPIIK